MNSKTAVGIAFLGATLVGHATVLTFDVSSISNSDPILQEYGDNVSGTADAVGLYGLSGGITPNITVSYSGLNEGNGDPVTPLWWGSGYGDLQGVVWGGDPSTSPLEVGQITLTPAAGFQVSLSSFDVGGWSGDYSGATVRVVDQFDNVLWDVTPSTILGSSTHSTFAPNLTSKGPLTIEWGDLWWIGMDNVTFSESAVDGGNSVPDGGSTLALLGLGVVGLVASKRRGRIVVVQE